MRNLKDEMDGCIRYTRLCKVLQGYAILVDEEFSCLEFYMNRDTISWILKKVGCLSEITAYLF